MKNRLAIGVAALALSAVASTAQFCTVGATVATLRIEGSVPSVAAPASHNVSMTDGVLNLSITDGGTFRPFILAQDIAGVTPFGYAAPIGCGALDLAAPSIVIDGIFFSTGAFDAFAHTDFSVGVTVAAPCTGFVTAGYQAICLDVTATPFPYSLTEAGMATQLAGFSTTYTSTTTPAVFDDGIVTHVLNGANCGGTASSTVTFAGTTYTQMFLGSNGMVSFNVGSTDFTATNAEFFAGFRTGVPTTPNAGVAMQWGDYFPSADTNDNITVVDFLNGSLQVQFNDMSHWNSGANAGSWSVTFDATNDAAQMDFTAYVAGTGTDTNRITGVTNGLPTGTTQTVLDLSTSTGYVTTVGPESIMENFPAPATCDLGLITFQHLGLFTWLIL